MISQIGNRASRTSDECPVPKSSTDIADPGLASAGRTCPAMAVSSTAAVSVISSVSSAAGNSLRRNAASTRAGEVGLRQVAGREVDARSVRPSQRARCGQRAVEHPVRQRADQGRSAPRRGGTRPAGEHAVRPAQQRLGAADCARAGADERLEVEVELAVLERVADVVDELALTAVGE